MFDYYYLVISFLFQWCTAPGCPPGPPSRTECCPAPASRSRGPDESSNNNNNDNNKISTTTTTTTTTTTNKQHNNNDTSYQ